MWLTFAHPLYRILRLTLALLICACLSACFFDIPEEKTALKTSVSISPNALAEVAIGKPGGTRVIGHSSLPNTFNPYLASDSASLAVLYQMFVGLTTFNARTQKIEPGLAQSWEANANKTVYTFRLRKGLKWSNGMPLTAKDVVFTYTQIINNPLIPNNYRDFWSYSEDFPRVEALDAMTVRFTLEKPFAPVLYNLMAPILPQHVFAQTLTPNIHKQLPFSHTWHLNTPPKDIVVNGPWQLKAYYTGERVELEPNPHYFRRDEQGQPLPYLQQFILMETQDKTSAYLKFKQGELDIYDIPPREYDLVKREQTNGDFRIHTVGPTPSSLFIMFNQSLARHSDGKPLVPPAKSRWFRDLAFRKALSHTLNKQGIIDSVYKGRAQSQYSHISAYHPFFNTQLKDYEYNPQKAAQILAEAGYHKNQAGQLLDPQKTPVSFRLTTNVTNAERDATCAILRHEWEKLGIKVDYRPLSLNTLVHQIHETHDWEVMMLGMATSPLDPHFSSSRWKTSGRMHLFNMGHPQNWLGTPTQFEPWEQQMENLYQAAAQEMDPEKRKVFYWKAQALERQYLPFIYTVSELSMIAVRNNIQNIFPTVFGGSGLNQVNWNSYEQFLKP